MSTINDFIPTDDVHDVLAKWIADLIPSVLRSEYKNAETLSGTRTLLDADAPIQLFDCDGADRIVKMPTGDAVENHLFFVVNSTGSGAWTLELQSNDGATTHGILAPGESQLLVPDGSGGYRPPSKSVYLSPASPRTYTANDTWNKPDHLAYVIVEVVAGGGGGGGVSSASGQASCAMAGGGGEYARKRIDAGDLSATETVTVGASGAGGSAGANDGAAGGNSSFGSHVSANGGSGGGAGTASASLPQTGASGGGAGGTGGAGGDLHIPGSPGISGVRWSSSSVISSIGGSSHLSGLAKASTNSTADENGVSGAGYGGGGSGARSSDTTTSYAGGAGSAGVVIVWEFLYG